MLRGPLVIECLGLNIFHFDVAHRVLKQLFHRALSIIWLADKYTGDSGR